MWNREFPLEFLNFTSSHITQDSDSSVFCNSLVVSRSWSRCIDYKQVCYPAISISLTYLPGTLVVVLARSRTGFHNSDTIVNRLIRGSVQTGMWILVPGFLFPLMKQRLGLLASVFSIIVLVCFLESPSTQFFVMFGIPIGRIYSNVGVCDDLLSICPSES